MCSEELGKMKIKTKGNQQTLEQDRCELNEMHSKQIGRWKHQHEWSTRSLILWGEQNLILAAGRTQSWGEGRDNREGWERTRHAAVYDSHNDHYLVQRLGAAQWQRGWLHQVELRQKIKHSACRSCWQHTVLSLTPLMYLQSTRGAENTHKVIPQPCVAWSRQRKEKKVMKQDKSLQPCLQLWQCVWLPLLLFAHVHVDLHSVLTGVLGHVPLKVPFSKQ